MSSRRRDVKVTSGRACPYDQNAGCGVESLYLNSNPVREQHETTGKQREAPETTANIISGMRPRTIGRALGIGVRVAGRIAGQRLAQVQSAQSVTQTSPASAGTGPTAQSSASVGAAQQFATRATRGVSQGTGGFLRSFRRVGGILWLEVTGVFFLLPVVVFAPSLWRESLAYARTSDHRTFWLTASIVAVFLYLGVSSFWRARRR